MSATRIAVMLLLTVAPAFEAASAGGSPVPLGHRDFYPSGERPVGWRGDGSGAWPGAAPVREWDAASGKNIVWKVPMPGPSFSQPIVVGDKVFAPADPNWLICLSAADGRILWQKQVDHTAAMPPDVAAKAREATAFWDDQFSQYAIWLDLKRGFHPQLPREQIDRALKAAEQHDFAVNAPGQANFNMMSRSDGLWERCLKDEAAYSLYSFGHWEGILTHTFPTPVSDGESVFVKQACSLARASARRGSAVFLLSLVAASLACAAASAAELPAASRMTLELTDALVKPAPKKAPAGATARPVPLSVYATCGATADGAGWADVWAYEYDYNHRTHGGTVTQSRATPGGLALTVALNLQGDPWAPGGAASYELDLKRVGDALEGTFTGAVKTGPEPYTTRGAVRGHILPPLQTLPGFHRVQRGEHPRLLLRKDDLPALRRRMQTPLGRMLTGLMGRSDDGRALGLMYQLTGDKAYTDRCADACRKTMAETGGGPFAVGRVWGYRVLDVAYDYDLCYDAWDAGFKRQCAAYLDHYCSALLYKPQTLGTPNIRPGSNYTFVMSGGAGVAAMALWGEDDEGLPPLPTGEPKAVKDAKPAAATPVTVNQPAGPPPIDPLGGSSRWAQMVVDGRRLNYQNIRRGFGDGGFQSEGEDYTLECSYVAFDYDLAYRNVFGTDLTGQPDIADFVPRYVETVVFTGRKDPHRPWQPFVNQTYGRGESGAAEWKYLSRCMPLTPEAWKPAVLWYWLQGAGVADLRTEEGLKQVFTRPADAKGSSRWLFNDASILLFTFLHYPLDLEPKNPETILPHAWQAAGKGFYAFRDHWNGPGDIVAQIYAKDGPHVGWNQAEAGCFQIYGLGHAWAWKDPVGGDHGKTGSRWQDNVVMLPDDPINAEGHGTTASYDAGPRTGTGVVTLDLGNVYKIIKADQGPKGPREIVNGGIRGTRSFAADYSGRCGAPALFAVADHITGGGRKVWVYQLPRAANTAPRKGETPPPAAQTTIEPDGFTIAYPDATFKVTFITPADPRITRARGTGANPLSGIPDAKEEAVHVTADDPKAPDAGDFFAVMTLQKGQAPAVRREGDGPAAKAVVGSRTVRLDGNTIVFAP